MIDAPHGLKRFIPHWETLYISLQRVTPESLTTIATALGRTLRVMQKEESPLPELRQVLREALAGLEELDADQASEWEEAAWFFVLLAYHRRPAEEYPELEQLILSRTRSSKFAEAGREELMSMTMAQVVEQRGEQRGTRQSLELVLAERFGQVPEAYADTLQAATPDALREWTRRAVKAARLEDVFRDE